MLEGKDGPHQKNNSIKALLPGIRCSLVATRSTASRPFQVIDGTGKTRLFLLRQADLSRRSQQRAGSAKRAAGRSVVTSSSLC